MSLSPGVRLIISIIILLVIIVLFSLCIYALYYVTVKMPHPQFSGSVMIYGFNARVENNPRDKFYATSAIAGAVILGIGALITSASIYGNTKDLFVKHLS